MREPAHKTLAALVEVRALQRRAAEAALARADQALRQEESRCDQARSDLAQAQQRWQEAASGERLDIALLRSFAAGVIDDQEHLLAQQAVVEAAGLARREQAHGLHAADARHEVMKDAATAARRRAGRLAEEARLMEMEDVLRRGRKAS